MAKSMILISGATGSTGGATARQLLKEGHAIRALAHREDDRSKLLQDLGAEVVYGDLLDIHAVTAAFGGVRAALFVGSPLRPEMVKTSAIFGLEIGKHTSELQSCQYLVCRLLLEKKKKKRCMKKCYV